MAKIKCSICSYQFNIWYVGHVSTHILIWFLALGQGSEVYLTLTTGCIGLALSPRAAHFYFKWKKKTTDRNTRASYCHHKRFNFLKGWSYMLTKISILTWRGSKPDHEGASSRVRLLHCTSPGLTPAITANVGNSTVQFLVVGACVRARSLHRTSKILHSCLCSRFFFGVTYVKYC